MKENFIQTEAKVTEITQSVSGRSSSVMATVEFTAQDGKNYISKVRLLHIPFVKTSTKVGDTITIFYDINNPYATKSKGDSFLKKYGIYILIALGVIFSIYNFVKHKAN